MYNTNKNIHRNRSFFLKNVNDDRSFIEKINVFTPQNKENKNKPSIVIYNFENRKICGNNSSKNKKEKSNKRKNNKDPVFFQEKDSNLESNNNSLNWKINAKEECLKPEIDKNIKLNEKILKKIDSLENTQNYLLSSLNTLMKEKKKDRSDQKTNELSNDENINIKKKYDTCLIKNEFNIKNILKNSSVKNFKIFF
jgi:hypothetical protein